MLPYSAMDGYYHIGNEDILTRPKAAVLNSRQSAFPVGADPWVGQTLRAIEYCAGQGKTIITSTGMKTWELVLALASRTGCPVGIISPDTLKNPAIMLSSLIERFKLNVQKTVLLFPEGTARSKPERLKYRDEAIIRTADLLLPVSLRPGGSLEALIAASKASIFRRYQIDYHVPKRPRPKYNAKTMTESLEDDAWLVHFTRTARGPWPHQSAREFYLSIIHSGTTYCNSAINSLSRILAAETIYARSRHIKSGDPVVGFTLLNRATIPRLFRYRPRDINPYFEPYGIAIAKSVALAAGAQPVVYGTSDVFADMPEEDKPYFQAIGTYGQWVGEREYRYLDDFHLGTIAPDSVKILVPFPREVELLQRHTTYPVQALFAA